MVLTSTSILGQGHVLSVLAGTSGAQGCFGGFARCFFSQPWLCGFPIHGDHLLAGCPAGILLGDLGCGSL